MSPSLCGWTGKVLRIDLSRRTFHSEVLNPDDLSHFIGGKGLAGLYLKDRISLEWDDPEMVLCLFAGPLTATIAPSAGRCMLVSRSPQTGAVADSSVGGRLGTELKRAGWDGIIIKGAAAEWTGLEIRNDSVEFVEAPGLQGRDTETVRQQVLKRFDSKASVASIGPAGEVGVRFACVSVDRHHAAGRCGLGAVFGKKQLKYIAVHGTNKVSIHDSQGIKDAREDIFRLAAASPVLMGPYGFTCYGTGAIFDLMHGRRMMPTDNFRKTCFEGAEKLNAEVFRKRYAPRKYGCKGCHILCKRVADQGLSMPEFETMSHFTALLGNRDIETVVRANEVCNALGMDTITAASTLACYVEIKGERLGPARILELLQDMGTGRGVGRELGVGSFEYARSQGREEASMSVKGLELPAYDPRGAYGMSLAYAVSTRGGCHLRAYPISHEILRKPVATDRFDFSGKARIIKISEDLNAVVDSLTACKFIFFAAGLEEYAKAFTAVTGEETTAQDLLKAGERIYYHDRVMNAKTGFSAEQDDLPARFFTEPGSSGNEIMIPPLNRERFLKARADYYRIRGLDEEGRPKVEKARELGVPWSD